MRHALTFIALLSLNSTLHAQHGEASLQTSETVFTLRIATADGNPAPGAEAYVIEGVRGLPACKAWKRADDTGEVRWALDDFPRAANTNEGSELIVIARAPGLAWSMRRVTLPVEQPVRLTLAPGKAVQIQLTAPEGTAIPHDFTPVIFSEGNSAAAWLTHAQNFHSEHGPGAQFSAAIVQRTGDGRYLARVPDDCEQFWVLVHHADVLRGYQAGPFDREALDAGRIDIALPRPGSIAINLAPDENKPHAYDACGYIVYCSPEIPDGNWSFFVETHYASGTAVNTTIERLRPGGYTVVAFTGTQEMQRVHDRPDFYRDQTWVELSEGGNAEASFALSTFDEAWLRENLKGEHKLTATVTMSDGTPAIGRRYALSYMLQRYNKELLIAEGDIPDSGEIVVENLPPGTEAMLTLAVGGEEVGYIFIDPSEPAHHASFSIAPAVGELAPEIALRRLDNDDSFSISSLRGRVVFLDFWASWCGPCQEPMAHNNAIVNKRTDWADRVVIIGASIDQSIDIIRAHVNRRGWTDVLQTFCDEGEPGWSCDAVKKYAVRGVPTCYLIDVDGRIVWTGHPMSINIEEEIDKLLAAQR